MIRKPRLLILNGSFCEQPIIEKAKEMGYYVITTGNMPHLIGHRFADEYIPADYSDKEAILQLVKDHAIEHVVSCANDFGVITAAYVAEKMGWKGHDTYEHAILLYHKDEFKNYCREKNIPSPQSEVFAEKQAAIDYARVAQFPVIVKANDLTGGKGILKAENYDEACAAIENAFTRSRDKRILIEPYLTGTQHTIVTFISNKKVIASASCNCYSMVNPYLIQAETFPADDIDRVGPELISIIEGIVSDLDLCDGIFALQYILCDGKPYIIEMMRRCFGNQFLSLVAMASGFPWDEASIRAAVGESCEGLKTEKPTAVYCGHYGVMTNRNGTVRGYAIPPEIEKHVFKKIEMIPPGGTLRDHLNERVAYLYYTYDDRDEMNREVKTYLDRIRVDVTD